MDRLPTPILRVLIVLGLVSLVVLPWVLAADYNAGAVARGDRERACEMRCLSEGAERAELHPADWTRHTPADEHCFCFRLYAPTWEARQP